MKNEIFIEMQNSESWKKMEIERIKERMEKMNEKLLKCKNFNEMDYVLCMERCFCSGWIKNVKREEVSWRRRDELMGVRDEI